MSLPEAPVASAGNADVTGSESTPPDSQTQEKPAVDVDSGNRVRFQIARKAYTCADCRRPIAKGAEYARINEYGESRQLHAICAGPARCRMTRRLRYLRVRVRATQEDILRVRSVALRSLGLVEQSRRAYAIMPYREWLRLVALLRRLEESLQAAGIERRAVKHRAVDLAFSRVTVRDKRCLRRALTNEDDVRGDFPKVLKYALYRVAFSTTRHVVKGAARRRGRQS